MKENKWVRLLAYITGARQSGIAAAERVFGGGESDFAGPSAASIAIV
jgi:hypothetical protein